MKLTKKLEAKIFQVYDSLFADCFDSARLNVFNDFQNGLILTSADGQTAFQQYFRSDIGAYIVAVSSALVTLSKQACSGSVSVSLTWTWTFFSCPN